MTVGYREAVAVLAEWSISQITGITIQNLRAAIVRRNRIRKSRPHGSPGRRKTEYASTVTCRALPCGLGQDRIQRLFRKAGRALVDLGESI